MDVQMINLEAVDLYYHFIPATLIFQLGLIIY